MRNIEPKFGMKLPPIDDLRTIPFPMLLKLGLLPELPASWDAHSDEAIGGGGLVEHRMFGNDIHNCCVKSMMAHGTLVFEKYEGGEEITIRDQEVIDEYFRETGGPDNGLSLLLAMKDWRNHGLVFGGKTYTIDAYAGLDTASFLQIKYCIYLLRNAMLGMRVYQTDVDQFKAGEPWHLTGNDGTFRGGHGVYGFRYNDADGFKFVDKLEPKMATGYFKGPEMSKFLTYNELGMTVMTWGEEQFGDWAFWAERLLQGFGVIDDKNKWTGPNSPINVPLMESQLAEITGQPLNPGGCTIGPFGKLPEIKKWLVTR